MPALAARPMPFTAAPIPTLEPRPTGGELQGSDGRDIENELALARDRAMKSVEEIGRAESRNKPESESPQTTYVEAIRAVEGLTCLSQRRIAQLFGTIRQTLYLWERNAQLIPSDDRRRILSAANVLQIAHEFYPTPVELVTWLNTPHSPEWLTPAKLIQAGDYDRARALAMYSPNAGLFRNTGPRAVRSSEEIRSRTDDMRRAVPQSNDAELFAQYGSGDEED